MTFTPTMSRSLRLFLLLLLVCAVPGYSAQAAIKSVEMLDTRTGMTLAALPRPLAFVETGIYDPLVPDKQPSVLYLGPEEWDRSGDFTYVLWAQVAPGVDGHRIDDIRSPGALVLQLDDGIVNLTALDDPVTAGSPYAPIPPVGQCAYFAIDVPLLKRMASSRKLVLKVRAGDLTMVAFNPRQETSAALKQFMIDRDIGDE
jgi:hypothetical protein